MGVDNSGYFVIGNEFDKINFDNFPFFDEIGEDDSILNYDKLLDLNLNWELTEPCGYEASGIFGYCLRSPSYGTSEYDLKQFLIDVKQIKKKWKEWTGETPKVFILNVQW